MSDNALADRLVARMGGAANFANSFNWIRAAKAVLAFLAARG